MFLVTEDQKSRRKLFCKPKDIQSICWIFFFLSTSTLSRGQNPPESNRKQRNLPLKLKMKKVSEFFIFLIALFLYLYQKTCIPNTVILIHVKELKFNFHNNKLYWCQKIQFLPLYPWCLLSYCARTGSQSKWVWESPCVDPLKGWLELQKPSMPLSHIPAGFYSQKLQELLLLSLEPWAGEPGVGLGPPTPRRDLCS